MQIKNKIIDAFYFCSKNPFLQGFLTESETFRYSWDLIKETQPTGEQSHGITVYEHTLMLVESLWRLSAHDDEWYQQRCGLERATFDQLISIVRNIEKNKVLHRFFMLVIYAHDFGKMESLAGHEFLGVAIIEKILKELGYPPDMIALGKELVAKHGAPAGIYFGEYVISLLLNTATQFPDVCNPSFVEMVVFLNILDVNSVKGGNGLYDEKAQFLLGLSLSDVPPNASGVYCQVLTNFCGDVLSRKK